MVILAVFGAIALLLGVSLLLSNRANMRRRARILDTPTSPIAQTPGGGIVEIKGRIVPSELGVVQSPISGAHGVWVRVTVEEKRSSGRSSYWAKVLEESVGQPFLVDDGSGEFGRVEPHNANVMLDRQNVANSGTFNDAAAHIEAFLASRGLKSTGLLGFNKTMRYAEEVLAPNDVVYALGPARRDPGPPVPTGYRGAGSTQLTLFATHGEIGELIISNKPEHELVSNLHYGFIGGLVACGIGALCFMGAAAMAVVPMLS